ncbi:Telomere end binding protein [Penicillium italicum]|uniref:Telomere end binding protein n=1 Tax=Penicillium italicum TaxID=40296 RepID=A0A0A2KAS1_PENIT|nr:Telomere end binding protein [Penicillium italicum]
MNAIEQSPEQSPAPNALAHLTRVPIAQLSPDLEELDGKAFLAAVALVWPYSSSTKSASLLLAEPDFRLRGAKGQIKVTFHGRVAEEVAESHIGIGDTVCLALKDIKFVSNEGVQKTPGRSVAWDAHFENGASLEIYRSSQPPLIISVEPRVTAPHETELAPPATPSGKSINPELGLPSSARPWGSPLFLKSTRTSFGGTIRSDFDPFAEDDGFVPGKGRKKPRYSLHREDWRVVNESESPFEQEASVDWEQALNQSIDQELDEADLASEPSDDPTTDAAQAPTYTEVAPQEPLPVFAKPSLELTGSILERHADESNVLSHEQVDNHGTPFHLPTDTPQIRPIPSPGLPIPSPLVSSHGGSASYFLPWTTPTQSQEFGSVPAEIGTIATPAASSIETQDTDCIDPTHTEIEEPADPGVEAIQQEHVFDAGFVLRDDSSPPGSAGLTEKQEVEMIDSSEAIVESHVVEADMIINSTGDEAQMSNEAEHGHAFDGPDQPCDHPAPLSASKGESDDSPDINHRSAAGQAETVTKIAAEEAQKSNTTDDERIIDLSYLWRDDSAPSSRSEEGSEDESLESSQEMDDSDIVQAGVGIETASDNIGSHQHPSGSHEEHFESEPHSVNDPQPSSAHSVNDLQPNSAFHRDAIDALERMITARDEEVERKRNKEEEQEMEEDINRPPSQGYGEEKVEMVKDEEVYYAESVENYDSQDEHGEDFPCDPRLDQDDFSVVGSSGENSEQEHNLPPQTGNHEVIVLDSDSDDEPDSKYPVASASQSTERDDHSHRFESGHAAIPPATANIETGVQEYPEPWYVGREDGYHGAVEEEDSNIDEGQESEENEESEYEVRKYNQQNVRIHESDLEDDESMRDHFETDHPSEVASPNPEQDEDKEMEDAELIEEADNGEYYAAAEHSAEMEAPVNRDSEEGQSGNTDPNLLDMPESHHQGPPSEVESHAGQYLTGDAQSDLHIPSSTGNIMADFLSRDEPTVEGPEPLGGRISPSIDPLFEQQLLTPDPTQENASTREPVHGFEPDSSFTMEEIEAPTGLDKTSQPAGSLESNQDDGNGTELTKNTRQELHVDGNDDSMAPSEVAEAAEPPATPEPSRSLEVVISTESPKTPVVPVSRPSFPDRNASGLRSKLSYFAPLATLIDHYNALVDTISIVHEASPITRAKSGSKDWFMTIQLTDPSMAGTTLRAQIFRRYKASMPSLAEGNAILLRDFKVRSLDHTVMLVSVDSSAWAVFDGSGPDAETNGPPVEYDSQERAYASGLRRWYVEVGSDRVADHMLQASIERDSEERDMTPSSQVTSESGSPDSKRGSQRKRKSNRRVTIHELRDGTRYTEVGSPNSGNSSVHELRDGTLYANI